MTTEKLVRQAVEAQSDYLLRRAYIAKLKELLNTLDKEAESIKHIELPLWYLEDVSNWSGGYRGQWIVDEGLLLVREDVDPDTIEWLKSICCSSGEIVNDFYREKTPGGRKSQWTAYEGPYIMISIGNEVTPAKKYYLGRLPHNPSKLRLALQQRLGTATWDKRPKDNGSVIRNYFWSQK